MQPMEFGFAHRAAKPQEQPIIILARVIDPILVNDESIGEGTDLNEAIPITTRTGQAGGFQTDHRACPSKPHFGNEMLKAGPPDGRSARLALVLVDDDNQMFWPPQFLDPFG